MRRGNGTPSIPRRTEGVLFGRAARARSRLLREILMQMEPSERARALRYLDEARDLAERFGDAGTVANTDKERLYVHLACGETEAALRLLPPLTDPDAPGADYSAVVGERTHYVKVLYAAGDWEAARYYFAEYEELAHRFDCFAWRLGDIPMQLRD